ncbi:MAG: adenosylcobinamide-GDP ribazoletransferase, partial [Spirochaetaceae bacterium]|nr:adenosylcobinamide-GDP ribazoletransferase [Spirochaetaceae bacterium]
GGVGFYLPIAGLFPSVLVALLATGSYLLLHDAFVAAVVALSLQYMTFNLFHLDGLLDSADAFLGPGDKDRVQRILKDSHIGVYALFVGTVYLVLKIYLLGRGIETVAALAEKTGSAAVLGLPIVVLVTYPVSGRAAAALVGASLPPARSEGLGALVGRFSTVSVLAGIVVALLPAVAGLVLRISVAEAASSPVGLTLVPLAILPAMVAGWLCAFAPYKRRLGGFTGDALGLAVEAGEIWHLFFFFVVTVLVGGITIP